MLKSRSRRLLPLILAVGVVLLVSIGFFATPEQKTAAEALESLSGCFTKRTLEYKADLACLKSVVTELVHTYQTEDLMGAIYANPTSIVGLNCHAIGHYIGEATYKREGSLDGALSRCTNDCRNSCTHGALSAAVLEDLGFPYQGDDIAHADLELLRKLGKEYCEKSSPLCHGVGHLAFIVTNNFTDALAICSEIGTRFRECGIGVYMQGSNTAESIGEAGLQGESTTVDYRYPCTMAPSKYKEQCFFELPKYQNNLFFEQSISSYREQLSIRRSTCESFSDGDRARCFFGLGSYAYQMLDEDGRVDERFFCAQFGTKADRGACTLGVAGSYISASPSQYHRALSYCTRAEERAICFAGAFRLRGADWPLCPEHSPDECISIERAYEEGFLLLPDYYHVILEGRLL